MGEDRTFIESLKGMRIGGRYIVEKVLGSGGMGVVATARYPELHQKVAIKFLRPEHAQNDILNARFVREARLAARVKSEHFVRVFDIGKLEAGVPYLVMELLTGRDLADELGESGRMKVDVALEWVLQACVGVAEIHALGVVHRDLKPSNLFIAEAAGKRMVKVLDFGISKENAKTESGAPLTSTDNLLGTPQYMSPEQVRASKDVDARSDIWAIGVILYELVTGKRPFISDENATGELFAKVLYIDPVAPREHVPELPVELEAVIMKCLARDREERYADVSALAEALRPFALGPSHHHVDAVLQALTMKRSMPPNALEDDEEDPTSNRLSQEPTASSSPHAKRGSGPSSRPSDQAPVTAMTSATGSRRDRERDSKSSSRKVIYGAIAVTIAVGVTAFGISSRTTTPAEPLVATSASLPSSAVTPPPSAEPRASVELTPIPADSASSVAVTPSAKAPDHPHPAGVAAKPRPSSAPSAAPSAKPATPGSLIEDRK